MDGREFDWSRNRCWGGWLGADPPATVPVSSRGTKSGKSRRVEPRSP